jgi:hypothetical protein
VPVELIAIAAQKNFFTALRNYLKVDLEVGTFVLSLMTTADGAIVLLINLCLSDGQGKKLLEALCCRYSTRKWY